jgi:hypothetical protein
VYVLTELIVVYMGEREEQVELGREIEKENATLRVPTKTQPQLSGLECWMRLGLVA